MANLKFDERRRKQYLDRLKEGVRRCAAATAVGVTPRTVQLYLSQHPEFEAEVTEAEREAHEQVEDALYQAALSGNVQAIQYYLNNRCPDRWQDARKISMSIDLDARIEQVMEDLRRLPADVETVEAA